MPDAIETVTLVLQLANVATPHLITLIAMLRDQGTDEAVLAKLDKEYAERIKRAEAAAAGQ